MRSMYRSSLWRSRWSVKFPSSARDENPRFNQIQTCCWTVLNAQKFSILVESNDSSFTRTVWCWCSCKSLSSHQMSSRSDLPRIDRDKDFELVINPVRRYQDVAHTFPMSEIFWDCHRLSISMQNILLWKSNKRSEFLVLCSSLPSAHGSPCTAPLIWSCSSEDSCSYCSWSSSGMPSSRLTNVTSGTRFRHVQILATNILISLIYHDVCIDRRGSLYLRLWVFSVYSGGLSQASRAVIIIVAVSLMFRKLRQEAVSQADLEKLWSLSSTCCESKSIKVSLCTSLGSVIASHFQTLRQGRCDSPDKDWWSTYVSSGVEQWQV